MPTNRTPPGRDDAILQAYEEWDPTAKTLADLATELGVSRSTIYNALERKGVEPKGHRLDPGEAVARRRSEDLLDRMAEMALDRLMDDLTETRRWMIRAVEVLRRYLDDPEVARLLADRP